MKSTQKLGKVLGTTPHLLESSDLPISLLPVGSSKKSGKGSRHERSVFTHSRTSSVSSFGSDSRMPSPSTSSTSLLSSDESATALPTQRSYFSDTKHGRSKDAMTPLFICLNTVPVSPSDKRFAPSLPPTPSTVTPQTSLPSTPCTPTFDQSEVKRKRMAKLSRHLGETIPPHLVSAASRQPRKHYPTVETKSSRRRSMSVGGIDSVSELGFSQHKPAVSYCPKPRPQARLVSWVGEWSLGDMSEVQKQLRALK
jgi:hypothetical protein